MGDGADEDLDEFLAHFGSLPFAREPDAQRTLRERLTSVRAILYARDEASRNRGV